MLDISARCSIVLAGSDVWDDTKAVQQTIIRQF